MATKLKNKRTGEIIDIYKGEITLHYNQGRKTIHFKRLEDLEEWEDYEEPKEYWCIDWTGGVNHITLLDDSTDKYEKAKKEIGNYFETKEEAELAVCKLKAWKRLKDKGFRFEGWDNTDHSTIHNFSLFVAIEDLESINKDLDLLFGGEE